MAKQLMKKGKRELASYIKSQCSTVLGHKHLNLLMDDLLDPHKAIDDFERIDWCRMIMAGGLSFDSFAETVRSYDNATMCGFVWTSDYVAYRCRTCGLSPCMSLCSDCFLAADHTGHDFNMFRSQAGGACDCGDPSVMKAIGFCLKHQPERAHKESAPHELLAVPELMMPRLICRLVHHLRDPSAHVSDGNYTVLLPETDHYLDFLQQLSDMGAAMRSVISKTVCDTALYKSFCEANSGTTGTQHSYEAALKTLRRVPVPDEFKGVPDIGDALCHTCLLDELFFWVLKYEFPQKIVTLLLSMLPDEAYKDIFTQSFVKHYAYISVALVKTKDKPRMSNCVVHISVQLLSPVQLASRMVIHQHLLHVMLSCLMCMMDDILTDSGFNDDSNHKVVDCSSPVMRDHSYWPIVSDIINVFSHRSIVDYFLSDLTLLRYWSRLVACFEGMNLNIREMMQHVEYEPESYYAAFSAELEICASPMWSLLQHLEDESMQGYTRNVINILVQQLQFWFKSTHTRSFTKPNPRYLSFHYPLHRYVSVFINCAVLKQGVTLESLNLSQEFLQLLMIHPLQLLVGFHEIYAGLWVRNGLQIRGQAMTYLQCHFCNSTIDADLFLLQVIASRLDADHYVQTVLERFHVLDCLTFQSNADRRGRSFLMRDQEMPMLEATLSFLCTLLSIRTYSGETTQDVTRQETVALLCMSDRTHSQLLDSLPEKCGLSGQAKDFEQVLKMVSEYKEPVFEHGGILQQGKYVPSGSTWTDYYDPLHVLLRSLHRRDFQASLDRYSEYIKQHNLFKTSNSLWPPFRIPGQLHPAYAGLLKLLECRTMHGLIFTLLYKAVYDPNMPDAIIYYTIYLLELAITIQSGDAMKRDIHVAENRKDKKFSLWFSSSNIFSNATTVIPQVTVSYMKRQETDMTMDLLTPHSPPVMESTNPPLPDVTYWETMPTDDSDLPSDVTSLSPGLLSLQVYDGTVSAVFPVPGADQMEVVPAQDSEDEKPATPKYRHQGVSAILDQVQVDENVAVNESILSLLLKLHTKLVGKGTAYSPMSRVTDDGQAVLDSRVGDGEYFVRKVLDHFCRKSEDCRGVIESMTALPEQSTSKNDMEESRKKAKQRQERLMKDFASKQRQFMEQMIATDIDMHTNEDDTAKQLTFDCCICGQTTASLDSRPIGLTALLQSSSILAHRRHSVDPVRLHLSDPTPCINNWGKEFRKRLRVLQTDFGEASWLMAVNSGWHGGVHVQTCGHYLHLDCHRSYLSALKNVNQQQSQNLQVDSGEFLCPVCRQLSNTVLPIPPSTHSVTSSPLEQNHARHVRELFSSVICKPVKSPLTSAMQSVMNDVTNACHPKFIVNELESSAIPNLLMFIGSLLRINLEMELVVKSNSQSLLQAASSLAQKKSCILPLFHILAMHYKVAMYNPRTDLWSHVTGAMMDQQSTSLSRYSNDVPLMLRDTSTMLIQFVLSLPPTFNKAVYQCIVQALYNVQLLQAIVVMSCRFSAGEHEAWRLKGHMDGCSQLEAIMSQVIESLRRCAIYDDEVDPDIPAICQSVWSPLSVEESVLDYILPFLRLSAQLQHHLFKDEFPVLLTMTPDSRHEFTMLASFLGMGPRQPTLAVVESFLTSTNCLHWYCDNPELLIQAWCQHLVQAVGQRPASYRMLLSVNPTWYPPQLLALPKSYDQIFQFYRKKQCSRCNRQPKSPALCLVCGELICNKEECCEEIGVMESVQHSLDCGGGTAMYLVVNSSVIIIVRGARAAIWGSVYLDKHGEEDRDLKRGKPLHLNEDRFRLLHHLWITHGFDHNWKQWAFHRNQL